MEGYEIGGVGLLGFLKVDIEQFGEISFSLEEGDRQSILWQMEGLRDRRAESREKEMQVLLPKTVTLFVNELGAAAGFGAALGEAQGERMVLLADRDTERAD